MFQRTPNYVVPARNAPLDAGGAARGSRPTTRRCGRRPSRGGPAASTRSTGWSGARGRARTSASASTRRAGSAAGSASSARSSTCWSTRRPTTPRRSSSATRSGRRCSDPDGRGEAARRASVVGCKRLCIDTGYYETFNRPNVTLVDVSADADRADHASAASASRGRDYALDALVLATGFDAMTGALLRIDIRGAGGRTLQGDVGGRARGPISGSRSRAFPTCSRSPGRAARRC